MTTTARPATDAELASRMHLAVTRLARRLRQQVDSQVTPSQLAVLSSLDRRGPMTLGELAAHERVQPPTMTRIAAALDEVGLVLRTPDPGDRRVARLALSPEGRRLLDRVRSRKRAWLAERIAGLGAIDRGALDDALGVIEQMLEERR